jgi:hypothetical protein
MVPIESLGSPEDCIGSPASILLIVDNVRNSSVNIDSSHSFSKPVALHHGSGYSPYFEVVGPHEDVSNTRTHDPYNPLIKILGLSLGQSVGNLSLNEASQALDLQRKEPHE